MELEREKLEGVGKARSERWLQQMDKESMPTFGQRSKLEPNFSRFMFVNPRQDRVRRKKLPAECFTLRFPDPPRLP
jgi:hypothetical protein